MSKKSIFGNFLLLLTAIIWGSAFVAQRSGLDTLGPLTFNGIRTVLGSCALLAFILIRSAVTKTKFRITKKELIIGALCGVIIFAATNLQQLGIATVNAGRAGFLTSVYIVMVPIIRAFSGKKLQPHVIAAVLLALVGLFFLSAATEAVPGESLSLSKMFSGFSHGDVLILLSALMYSIHIIAVDKYAQEIESAKLSFMQFSFSAVITLPCIAIFESFPSLTELAGGWTEIAYAGLMSTAVAYTLQIAGQKLSTNPTVAAVLMSTESMFAVIFGMLILHETHSSIEYLGCVLVFAAVILAQMPINSNKSKTKETKQ